MKATILILFVFSYLCSYAQLGEGKRIISTALSNISFSSSKSYAESDINPRIDDHNWGVQVWPEITYGRLKNNNLFMYGLALRYSHDNAKNSGDQNRYAIFPTIGLMKYYKIADKIYFSPSSRFMIGYEHSVFEASPVNSKRIGNSVSTLLSLNPIGIAIEATKKTIVYFGFARMAVSFERLTYKSDPNPYNFRSVSSVFSFNSSINGSVK